MGDNSNSSEKRGRHLKAASENERPEKTEKKKKHVGRTVIIVIAAVLAVLLLAGFLIFRDLYSQMNTRPRSTPTYSAVSTSRAVTFCSSMIPLHSAFLSSASRHATASSEIVQRRW